MLSYDDVLCWNNKNFVRRDIAVTRSMTGTFSKNIKQKHEMRSHAKVHNGL